MSQQINLYSPVFLRQKKYFSAPTMLQGLALVAGGCLLLYIVGLFQTLSMQRLAAATEEQLKNRRGQLVALGGELSQQGRSKLLDEEVARLETRLRQREALMANLRAGAGGDAAGFSPYLTALARRSANGVWLTEVSVTAGTGAMTIKGRALSADLVPAYIRLLNREPAIHGRQIAELRVASKEDPPSAGKNQQAPARYVEFVMNLAARPGEVEKPAARKPS